MQEAHAGIVHHIFAMIGRIKQRRTGLRTLQHFDNFVEYIIRIIDAVVIGIDHDGPVVFIDRRDQVGRIAGELLRVTLPVVVMRTVRVQHDQQVAVALLDDLADTRQHLAVGTVIGIQFPFARRNIDAAFGLF